MLHRYLHMDYLASLLLNHPKFCRHEHASFAIAGCNMTYLLKYYRLNIDFTV